MDSKNSSGYRTLRVHSLETTIMNYLIKQKKKQKNESGFKEPDWNSNSPCSQSEHDGNELPYL